MLEHVVAWWKDSAIWAVDTEEFTYYEVRRGQAVLGAFASESQAVDALALFETVELVVDTAAKSASESLDAP